MISTKFFCNRYRGNPNGGGAGRKAIYTQCEHSLRRLQTDYIDVYWLHQWDRFTPIEETMRALDDLVRSGKVRYLGFSDTPAWKVAQAQMLASFRGLSPLIGLQLEYSLLERTVEGEQIPMARELGLGVLPWAPLKSGVLSGKYTRENASPSTAQGARGVWARSALNERAYAVIDELVKIAKALETTPARVALAWVHGRPGVTSTIIGARTMEQLDEDLAALEVHLAPQHVAALDAVSKPTLDFPAELLATAGGHSHGGVTVTGESIPCSRVTPEDEREVY